MQEGLKGKAEVKQIAARRLLAGSPVVTDAFATTSAALNGESSPASPISALLHCSCTILRTGYL